MDQTSIKIRSKTDQRIIKNNKKSRCGRLQGRFGGVLGRLGRSKASLEASWTVLEASWRGLGGLLGGLGPRKVPNMVPTWLPKRSQNQVRIDPKIDQFFNASWNRIFERCWWIWEPKWHQIASKMASQIDLNIERRFL